MTVPICASVSPYAAGREEVRKNTTNFVEVYIECSVEVAESRDTDGLYAKARSEELADFTGVNAPYEAPEAPEVQINADRERVDSSAWKVVRTLEMMGIIPGAPETERTAQEDDIRRRLVALGYI